MKPDQHPIDDRSHARGRDPGAAPPSDGALPATQARTRDGFDQYRRRFFARIAAVGAACASAGSSAVDAPKTTAAAAAADGASTASAADGPSATPSPGTPAWGGSTLRDVMGTFFQGHYQRMSRDEIGAALARIERRAKARHGVDVRCEDTPPIPGAVFGYALNISKCKGYRDCVEACVKENNLGRDSQMQYIRVLELDRGTLELEKGDHYYHPAAVPQPGKVYLPVQCQQCDNPPCVKACPVEATWKESDGIVVVDYDWCIGCRYCMTACPYWARHFNWTEPRIPAAEVNREVNYLGNRPRPRGVVEKCHFCTQRTRKGRQPACQEACPTGARVFGNLMDPRSEIRWILANKQVFRLKEELGTEPKFWYFTDDRASS